ncbi:MAG: glycosyltransferase family 2 protein [Chloroflexi bacterium]|nr:glycosyltransferase family 2 protein [Chloroflexota bacterium]
MEFFTALTLFGFGVMFYHYALYPLVMAVAAKRQRPSTPPPPPFTPPLSLIIAAYNEAPVIAAKLANSLALHYPPGRLQIIVVADGSSDETPALVRGYADQGITLLYEPERRGKSAAINRAMLAASGDIIVLSDANAFYQPEALLKLTRHFQDGRVGAVSGQKTVQSGETAVGQSSGLYWKYESAIKTWESRVGSTVAVVGEMLALRRSLFSPIPTAVINDDAYLATLVLRQGNTVLYEPEAICWETASSSTADELIRRRRISAGRYQLLLTPTWWPWGNRLALFQLLSHKFLRLLLPFFMLAVLATNVTAVLRRPSHFLLRLTLLSQIFLYGLAVVGWLAEKYHQSARIPAAVYYIVSGNFSSLHGLWRLLTGKQSVLWEKAQRE